MHPMNNFSWPAQQLLALAHKEADRLQHDYVDTEHILLGMLRLPDRDSVNLLKGLELDAQRVRSAIEQRAGVGRATKPRSTIRYTPRVKKVLAVAGKEAVFLHHSHVGPGHVLLGIVRDEEGMAGSVLRSFGMDLERIRARVALSEGLIEGGPGFRCGPVPESGRGNFFASLRCGLRSFLGRWRR